MPSGLGAEFEGLFSFLDEGQTCRQVLGFALLPDDFAIGEHGGDLGLMAGAVFGQADDGGGICG